MNRVRSALVALVLLAALSPAANAGTRYGDIDFPQDEHQHLDGWDYWWGAADLVTESGNRYTVGFAFNSHYGYGVTGHQLHPRQGPYKGRSILTADGPTEWGHPGEVPGQFLRQMSVYAPGASELLDYRTLDTANGMKDIGRLRRTSAERERYRLALDNDEARVHPTGERIRWAVELDAEMRSPPLLLGGTGRWWYGIPQAHHYPSRSFQYMQAAQELSGTLELEQPDGSIVRERVVPGESQLVMVHEYDASPEDLFAGLALAEATQIHPRYAQYYHGGMPWDLIFLDLENGAQLMVAVLAFHETERGTLTPLVGQDQPTYATMATLRLPSGESVVLDEQIHVEHVGYRAIIGHVPTFLVAINGVWTQAWDYRVSHPGGTMTAGDGSTVEVPPFDLGVVPQFDRGEPAIDERGNRQSQRVPFLADGSYGGCPVHGFGWSELIINWYGKEEQDPWFTGGGLPPVPAECTDNLPTPPSGMPGNPTPPAGEAPPPELQPEGCTVYNPGPMPTCEYDATHDGGVGGFGSEPGGWTVTITRPGEPEPRVITSFGGQEMYACGAIRPGDHVVAIAEPGSGVVAGNPGICF